MAEQSISNPKSVTEDTDERIISHNFDEMRSSMMRLLTVESIGGNAGFVEIGGRKLPCAAARGFADGETGEILFTELSRVLPAPRSLPKPGRCCRNPWNAGMRSLESAPGQHRVANPQEDRGRRSEAQGDPHGTARR